MATFCPATMCPLFAANGSPWTGEINAACPHNHADCAWFDSKLDICEGRIAASQQIIELTVGRKPLVIGSDYRDTAAKPTTFDCPRAADCEWQIESGKGLCPPRMALSKGLDPRACAY